MRCPSCTGHTRRSRLAPAPCKEVYGNHGGSQSIPLRLRKRKCKAEIETHFLQSYEGGLAVSVELLRQVDRKGRKRVFALCTSACASEQGSRTIKLKVFHFRLHCPPFPPRHRCSERGEAGTGSLRDVGFCKAPRTENRYKNKVDAHPVLKF